MASNIYNRCDSVEEVVDDKVFFKNKSFCLDFPTSLGSTKKNQYIQFIKENGGKIDFSITSKTNYYITHISNITSQSFRTKNALKLNIGILLDTFIYDVYLNNQPSSSSTPPPSSPIDLLNYLYINGSPSVETINYDNIEHSISQSNSILNNILSTLSVYNKPIQTYVTTTITTQLVEEDEEDDEFDFGSSCYSSSDSVVFGDIFSSNKSSFAPYIPTLIDTSSTLISSSSSSKPLSRFEQLLLIKKENAEKKRMETQRIEDEKRQIKIDLLESKRKERLERLEIAQKEKEIKIESEKLRRKEVLEKTKSTLTSAQLIKLTISSSSSSSTSKKNNKNAKKSNNNNNNKPKLQSSSFGLKIDHEGIRIRKEQERIDRLNKVERENEIKKQEKLERTRIFNQTKQEQERIESEEKARKEKESLEAFLKRQEKRIAKEKKELKEKEEASLREAIGDSAATTIVELVDEDLRKLFVGGINLDDITDEKVKKDIKQLEKIKEKRIQCLLKLFDKFGPIQKRVVDLKKSIFFITYKDVDSCSKAVEHYSQSANRKAGIESIALTPKKSPFYNPNKNFYVKFVKSQEKAKKKQFFDKQKVENIKSSAKEQIQKEEDDLFADWDIAQ